MIYIYCTGKYIQISYRNSSQISYKFLNFVIYFYLQINKDKFLKIEKRN